MASHSYGHLPIESIDGRPLVVLNHQHHQVLYAVDMGSLLLRTPYREAVARLGVGPSDDGPGLIPVPTVGMLVEIIDHDDAEGAVVDVVWQGVHWDARADTYLLRRPQEPAWAALERVGLPEENLLP